MTETAVHARPLRAPFPWFGGKSRAAALVWTGLGDVSNYVEPFAGSLAVLLGRPTAPHIETVNDRDCYLANWWRAVQHDPAAVAQHADWPVNECVPAGTMIATPTGDVPVELVKPGMTVWGEQDGHLVPTTVLATRQDTASEFIRVGPLRVTGNHPVWTLERGYVEARHLTIGTHVKVLDYSVNKTDLSVLHSPDDQSDVGGLLAQRPADGVCAVCRGDLSREATHQRTPVTGVEGGPDASRLLDPIVDHAGVATGLQCHRAGERRRLAGPGALLDRQSSADRQPRQPHRRWRRDAGVCADSGTPSEVVGNAEGGQVCPGPCAGDAGQAPCARGTEAYPGSGYESPADGRRQSEDFGRPQGEASFCGASTEAVGDEARGPSHGDAPGEDRGSDHESKARELSRDGENLPLCHCGRARTVRHGSVRVPSHPQRLSLQGKSSPVRVAVHNFQTTTGNYFAAGILVHNCDLHARHLWLVQQESFRERMLTDPEFYDTKIAGWWVWGLSCWIGGGWCDPAKTTRRRPRADGWSDHGVHQKRPVVAGDRDGNGVHRKAPRIDGNGGTGLHGYQTGVSRQMPQLDGEAGNKINPVRGTDLQEWFSQLAARLRRTRVVCGDWTRVLTPTVLRSHGVTGVVLDPPYAHEAEGKSRASDLYVHDAPTISADARAWALEHGDDPSLRIVLCGYDGEHAMPETWRCEAWKAGGGYSNQRKGGTNDNARRERLWFSPHCLRPIESARHEDLPLFGGMR